MNTNDNRYLRKIVKIFKKVFLSIGATFLMLSCTRPVVTYELDSIIHPDVNESTRSVYSSHSFTSQTIRSSEDLNNQISLLNNSQIEKCDELLSYQKTIKNGEIYCFFTDTHNFSESNEDPYEINWLSENFALLREVCNYVSADYIVFGGDCINGANSRAVAYQRLILFKEMFHRYFENSFLILGNHDTNYQGDEYVLNKDYTNCVLSQEEINYAFFDGEKSYYSFAVKNTSHFCFDSGLDWEAKNMTDYRWEQVYWFANKLLTDKKPNKIIFVHMPLMEKSTKLNAFMSLIGEVIEAFNKRGTVTLDKTTYDFSSCEGKISYAHAGHSHRDLVFENCGGIPIIVTTNYYSIYSPKEPTFDLVSVDLDNNILKSFRIGDGEDRILDIYY